MKASIFIAVSLDGYIARRDGDIDWLTENEKGEEDYGFQDFLSSVDALVMGRHTYEKVRTFEKWPYGGKRVIVLSSRQIDTSSDDREVMSGPPQEIAERLSAEGLRHLYIDGGKTIQGFLGNGLIDEMTITTIPILIGEGIPLFGHVKQDIKWRHIHTRYYDSGLVQSRYAVR